MNELILIVLELRSSAWFRIKHIELVTQCEADSFRDHILSSATNYTRISVSCRYIYERDMFREKFFPEYRIKFKLNIRQYLQTVCINIFALFNRH
eukprot:snap_masked-scaffold_1-processed-gene-6.27-mRNA-1 protein AED:1.00 eAED:1.00 QI:0/0/0/0/1/1/3/0/94